MNGAQSAIQTAVDAGVNVCFANPGTTEMPLVAALDSVRGVRAVLGLFEGVCTGAADGYARMSGRPAMTLLHLGPGFTNGIANLHNARRARSPIVNLIGDHATWHVAADAPLTSDIASLASPVSAWVRTNEGAVTLGRDTADAIHAAMSPSGHVSTLIVPHDAQWEDAPGAAAVDAAAAPTMPEEHEIVAIAEALGNGAPTAILLGGPALHRRTLEAAARVAAATGAELLMDTFLSRVERGAGVPAPERLAYFPEQVLETLGRFEQLVVVGTRSPVAFFAYPEGRSSLLPEACTALTLAGPEQDVTGALEALAERVGAPASATGAPAARPERPTGALDIDSLGRAVAALQPEGAIVMDEAATSGLTYFMHSQGAPPHSLMMLTGGAIGQGLPCATGAAIACPDRKVIALQADGSGMYTLQSLWTMARESLDVTVVLCANRAYRILQFELARAGVAEPGKNAMSLTDLSSPVIDWVSMSKGLGVPAVRAETADELVAALDRSLAEPGPSLIEALL